MVSVSARALPPAGIKHVVVILQADHTFDNIFGTFPGANGTTTRVYNGMPLGRTPIVPPCWINDTRTDALLAFDSGKMDRFGSSAALCSGVNTCRPQRIHSVSGARLAALLGLCEAIYPCRQLLFL
jgi:hypothetical protein